MEQRGIAPRAGAAAPDITCISPVADLSPLSPLTLCIAAVGHTTASASDLGIGQHFPDGLTMLAH